MTDEPVANSSESARQEFSAQSELRWSRPDSEGHIPAPSIRDVTGDFSWTGDTLTEDEDCRSQTVRDVEELIDAERQERVNRFKDPLIGTVLDGKYRILSVLGFGGMSVVYKAEQELIEKFFAVKTVKFRVDERPSLWQRFEREVKTLSKLSHPNIVTVYDCVLGEDGQPYVVMDYLEGQSLDQVLQQRGRFSLKQLLSIATQSCSAVAHAHRNNVIHRDIKPANIMVIEQKDGPKLPPLDCQAPVQEADEEPKYQVKVVDFGLAKLGEDSRKLTQSGELWGSPPYMSPEQIVGADCDGRSDIYSLGCVVYEMATGRDPFWTANVYELLHKHLNEAPPTLKEACPEGDFPPHLQAVLEKAMAKNPEDRFASMTEFREALEAACSLSPELAMAPLTVRKPGQTGYRMQELRSSSNKNDKSADRPENGSLASTSDSFNYNLYLAWTMTALLAVACILFVFNETTRPRPYVKRTPYHTLTRTVPVAPVPPPVASTKAPPRRTATISAANNAGSVRRRRREPADGSGREKVNAARVNVNPVKKSTWKSPPNSSAPAVDQSKFELLRRLKSAPLKNEGTESNSP